MQIKFGTDGWRGVIARDFTFANLADVAQATMDWLHEDGLAEQGLVIGYDRRFLSPDFALLVAEVATGNGIKASLAESFIPTPAVSWAVKELKAGAGIMITASHNPSIYNGFKVKEQYGGSARPATTARLEKIVAQNRQAGRTVQTVPFEQALADKMVERVDLATPYLQQLARIVDLQAIRKAGINAVVDPMYGAGSGFIPRLLDLDEIHHQANPGFGGCPPEPIGEHLTELSALIRTGKYMAGLALDGDADRIGAVDESGSFFSSHNIFTLLLKHLVERKGAKGAVVKTVSSTKMVDLLAAKYGLELFETPIGFKHICEIMLGKQVLMGGEESGGLGISSHLPERDGILMALLLLETMAVTGKGLREQLNEVMDENGHLYYHRIDLAIDLAGKEKLLQKLASSPPDSFAGHKICKTNFMDGYKFIFANDNWLLIRPSGTEPVLRLYSEAEDEQTVSQLLQAAKKYIGVV